MVSVIIKYVIALLTTACSVSQYPSEDEKLRATSLSTRRGGNCPNTLEVLQDLGIPIALDLIAVLPNRQSSATAKIEDSLKPGVSLQACLFREDHQEPPSSYIIKNAASGSRTIINYNELPEMTCDEFSQAANMLNVEDTWYHFEVSMRLEHHRSPGWKLTIAGPDTRCHSSVYKVYPQIASERSHQCRTGETGATRFTGTCPGSGRGILF